MICLFHRLCKKPTNPTMWIFFDEKETLEESNEHCLDQILIWDFFLFLDSGRKQLYIPVYVVPIVEVWRRLL